MAKPQSTPSALQERAHPESTLPRFQQASGGGPAGSRPPAASSALAAPPPTPFRGHSLGRRALRHEPPGATAYTPGGFPLSSEPHPETAKTYRLALLGLLIPLLSAFAWAHSRRLLAEGRVQGWRTTRELKLALFLNSVSSLVQLSVLVFLATLWLILLASQVLL